MSAMVSVVLCTYNGAAYLPSLLDSLAGQSCLPDELLVYDDGSTDSTATLVANFAQHAPFPVSWHVQTRRLGPAANFVVAAQQAGGTWIAFCDQDDVWHPDKLSTMYAAVEGQPAASAVFCNARLVDARGRPQGGTLWAHVDFTPAEQHCLETGLAWEVLVKHPVVCGAGLMIHSRVRDHLNPIAEGWMHDAWAALLAAALGPLVSVPMPLFDYRQHGGNLIGASRLSWRQQWALFRRFERLAYLQSEDARWQALAERLQGLTASPWQEATRLAVVDKLNHLRRRQMLPRPRRQRLLPLWRDYRAGHYRRFTKGWRPLLADLLLR